MPFDPQMVQKRVRAPTLGVDRAATPTTLAPAATVPKTAVPPMAGTERVAKDVPAPAQAATETPTAPTAPADCASRSSSGKRRLAPSARAKSEAKCWQLQPHSRVRSRSHGRAPMRL